MPIIIILILMVSFLTTLHESLRYLLSYYKEKILKKIYMIYIFKKCLKIVKKSLIIFDCYRIQRATQLMNDTESKYPYSFMLMLFI